MHRWGGGGWTWGSWRPLWAAEEESRAAGIEKFEEIFGWGGRVVETAVQGKIFEGGGYAASQAGRAHAPAQMQQQKRAEAIARAERGQRIAERASKACDQLVPALQSIKHTRHKAHPLNCRANNHIIQLSRSARDCLGQWHLRPNGHCVAARVRENLLGSFRMGKRMWN
jgi:hypothetical protein